MSEISSGYNKDKHELLFKIEVWMDPTMETDNMFASYFFPQVDDDDIVNLYFSFFENLQKNLSLVTGVEKLVEAGLIELSEEEE